jgi:hypothetical protein
MDGVILSGKSLSGLLYRKSERLLYIQWTEIYSAPSVKAR